jgi:hypothetical protein
MSKPMENKLNGFEDPQRLRKIDKLMELGIGDYISLPQVHISFELQNMSSADIILACRRR